MKRGLFLLLVSALSSYGFLGLNEPPGNAGNDLFTAGKYDEAINKYGEALVDDPDSAPLNFNMGDAHYKSGNYSEALASFGRVRAEADSEREARVAYNIGNVKHRVAAQAEADKPQDALKGYAEALASYRRALGINPRDEDAKFNYELTVKRIKDLKERLEKEKQQQQENQDKQQEEQKQDEQQQDQQQQAEDQQQQKQEEQQEQKQEQGEQQEEKQEEKQEQAQQEQGDKQKEQQQVQKPEQGEQQEQQEAQAAEGEEAGEKDEMNKREASALVDAARNDELRPEEFVRRVQGGALAQPAQDW